MAISVITNIIISIPIFWRLAENVSGLLNQGTNLCLILTLEGPKHCPSPDN